MTTNANDYPPAFILAHWVLALLVLLLLGLGWYMVDIPAKTPARGEFFNLHKSFGLIAMSALLATIVLRLRLAPPPLPEVLAGWERRAAAWAHVAMYVLLFTAVLSGYVATNFSRWGIDFFGMGQIPSWGPTDRTDWYRSLKILHIWSANGLALLVLVHLLAVFKHVARKVPVLRRMLPAQDER